MGNKYFIKKDESELMRLVQQDDLLNQHTDLIPKEFVPSSHARIVDLACGHGGWVLDVVKRFPEDHFPNVEVTGVDIDERMIAYAKAQALVRNTKRAHFVVGDILQPLQFPDCTFDQVNARLLQGFMSREAWKPLIGECYRITKPGGMIRLTETTTWTSSNAPKQEELSQLLYQAFWRAGMSFAKHDTGIVPMLKPFLESGGYQVLSQTPYLIDLSHGTDLHRAWAEGAAVTHDLIKPFLLNWTSVTEAELTDLFQGVMQDMRNPDRRELWVVASVVGQKPLS